MKRYEKYKPIGIEWIGEVPEHWELKKIKFCFDVYAGATPKTENPDNWDGDIVWVTPADYKTEDKYIRGGQRTITKQGYDSCNTQIVPKGSIVFSKRAPIGTVAISDVELCTNQGCLSCVPKGTNSTYYYYVMTVSTECFDLLGSGATFKEISADSFSNVKLPFPTPVEQEAIAAYLDVRCGDIDKVVATQEKRIALLNEMKQSIITQAVTRGLNPDAKMKDSGVEWIGMVPEHWETLHLKHVLSDYQDGTHGSFNRVDTKYPLLSAKNVWEDGIHITQEESTISKDDFDSIISNGFPKKEDIVLCCVGTIGRCCIYTFDYPFAFQRSVTFLRVNDKVQNKYLLYQLRSQLAKRQFDINAKTSAQSGIYMDTLVNFNIVLPSLEEQKEIATYLDERCSEIDKQIGAVTRQIELLREYKQSLITEVVTGKRKVC